MSTGKTTRTALSLLAAGLLATGLSGCNTFQRLSEIGQEPEVSPIVNPTQRPSYRPVSMPMPAPKVAEANPNSLWRSGAKAFFKDHRAKEVGDILTVTIDLSDSASFNNTTERDRDDSEDTDLTNILGLEAELAKKLPQAIDPTSLLSFGNVHSTSGEGSIDRNEDVEITVAAVITQVLPNGNLVITGRQEMRVNYELRELLIQGIIRPSDIDPSNSISHEKIAEMRMAYGGRGTLSDLQQPRWGTQVWDIVFPF